MWKYLCVVFLLLSSLIGEPLTICTRDPATALFYDLELAVYFDNLLHERFPITYNHLFSTGYFTTPSARMGCAGDLGIGVIGVPPYIHLNGRMMPFSHLELTANYRVFKGVDDPSLSKDGFGNFADRGANFKIALFTPEDSDYILPGFAFGVEDFMGSKAFTNYFVVATKVWKELGLEGSFGWGGGRYTRGPSKGFFGGVAWSPFWRGRNWLISGISFSAEYDPIDYSNPKREPHPDGQNSHTPINVGAKYKLCNVFDMSASWIRGKEFAYGGSLTVNLGTFKGMFPKLDDPLPYTAPVVTEPIGIHRSEQVMIDHLGFAFENQCFILTGAWIEDTPCGTRLWLRVLNEVYRTEKCVKDRIECLLAALCPTNIDEVIVILESYALLTQKYVYPRALLSQKLHKKIGRVEFELLTLRQDPAFPPCSVRRIFYQPLDLWRCRISPRLETFFGSAKGKFKYDLGVKGRLEGFLPRGLYYELQISTAISSTMNDVSDFDRYNPSQLPNVMTDYVNYRNRGQFSTDKAYIQKSWTLKNGLFGRGSIGYFQVNYAGIAGEFLYYPARSTFAIGVDGAILKKRRYNGLGFQNRLRRLDGTRPTYQYYSTLEQWFLTLYFDFPEISVTSKISAGQFLARDKGGCLEVTRYFQNGLRLTGWITLTDAGDKMHGETFYNRGIALEFPLDFFFKHSSKRIFNYGLAAWLRDAGALTTTGRSLFEIINADRR
ncbi:MAG: YjbH domain-containing protein [Chlamydiia bacterium]|nr:YjbH domain-containing protein [Chlamydiia bacterium]